MNKIQGLVKAQPFPLFQERCEACIPQSDFLSLIISINDEVPNIIKSDQNCLIDVNSK
jgi:hypothetical protein